MKVATLEQFVSLTDEDLAARRREMSALLQMASNARVHEVNALTRAMLCASYAHWEGFVRLSSERYFSYLSILGLRLDDVKSHLRAIHYRGLFINAADSKSVMFHTELVDTLLSMKPNDVDFGSYVVDTRSNLNSDRLQEISCALGINYSGYETRANWIDVQLVARRNRIAHGEMEPVSLEEARSIKSGVDELLGQFRTDTQNSLAQKLYLLSR